MFGRFANGPKDARAVVDLFSRRNVFFLTIFLVDFCRTCRSSGSFFNIPSRTDTTVEKVCTDGRRAAGSLPTMGVLWAETHPLVRTGVISVAASLATCVTPPRGGGRLREWVFGKSLWVGLGQCGPQGLGRFIFFKDPSGLRPLGPKGRPMAHPGIEVKKKHLLIFWVDG